MRRPRAAGGGSPGRPEPEPEPERGAGRAGGRRVVPGALTGLARPARPQRQDGEGDPVL